MNDLLKQALDAGQAEIDRLQGECNHWRQSYENWHGLAEELRVKIKEMEEQEPVDYQILILGNRWTHCSKEFYEKAADKGIVRALYTSPGAKT